VVVHSKSLNDYDMYSWVWPAPALDVGHLLEVVHSKSPDDHEVQVKAFDQHPEERRRQSVVEQHEADRAHDEVGRRTKVINEDE
jgi:hypothetical protein